MKNIFENAKYGDKYVTRDGSIVFYCFRFPTQSTHCVVMTDKYEHQYHYNVDGTYYGTQNESPNDIVCINEDKAHSEIINIKKSKFGDIYKTRNGRKAIVVSVSRYVVIMYIENCGVRMYKSDGLNENNSEYDIVEKFVSKDINNYPIEQIVEDYLSNITFPNVEKTYYGTREDFIEGFKKALEVCL